MLKVIDLDPQGKDADGLVFTLTIAGEKFGLTYQEVVELIRAKHGAGKAGAKRLAQRAKTQPSVETVSASDEALDHAHADTEPDGASFPM
jgi:hypothetical protein